MYLLKQVVSIEKNVPTEGIVGFQYYAGEGLKLAGCLPVNEYRRALLSIVALSEREFMIDEHKQFPVEVPDDDLFQGIVFEGASAGKFTIGEKDILSHRSGDHIPGNKVHVPYCIICLTGVSIDLWLDYLTVSQSVTYCQNLYNLQKAK